MAEYYTTIRIRTTGGEQGYGIISGPEISPDRYCSARRILLL